MIIILLWHTAVSMQVHLEIFTICSDRFHIKRQSKNQPPEEEEPCAKEYMTSEEKTINELKQLRGEG